MARLLGIRLLKLDATVVIAPADVTAPSSTPQDSLPPRPPARRSLDAPPSPSGKVGGGLAEAVRNINEGAAILAEARHPVRPGRVSRNGGARR